MHCLLACYTIKLCLSQSVHNQLLNYLTIVVRDLRTADLFYALIVYHQHILNTGSSLLARSLTMSCPLFLHTFQSSFTSFQHGTTKHKQRDRASSPTSCLVAFLSSPTLFGDISIPANNSHHQQRFPDTAIPRSKS